MLTVGSLFSGIGGLEDGLEKTGGFKTIWQCEIEPYPSKVLRKHWPEVPNLGDITKVDWKKIQTPDVICGGFPCQDISTAGKGAGITGKRSGLWKEFLRAIKTTRPTWIIAENVPALVTRGLAVVLEDLWFAGYTPVRPILIEAASVGALHKRERIFIVAHTNSSGHIHRNPKQHPTERGQSAQPWTVQGCAEMADSQSAGTQAAEQPEQRNGPFKSSDTIPDSLRSRCQELNLSQISTESGLDPRSNNEDFPNPDCRRLERTNPQGRDRLNAIRNNRNGSQKEDVSNSELPTSARFRSLSRPGPSGTETKGPSASSGPERRTTESRLGRTPDGFSKRLYERSPWKEDWEKDTPRTAKGVKNRIQRLTCLGNAVVPQVAQCVGEAILAMEEIENAPLYG